MWVNLHHRAENDQYVKQSFSSVVHMIFFNKMIQTEQKSVFNDSQWNCTLGNIKQILLHKVTKIPHILFGFGASRDQIN